MKRMYTVALYDDMLARIRETVPEAARLERLHRRLLRRDRGVVREVRAAGRTVPVQEQLHLQVQPAAGHQGRHPLPTTCPRRSRSGGTTTCSPSRPRSARRTTARFVGRTFEVLVEGPSKSAAKRDPAEGFGQLTGRTRCDRIVVFEGHERLVGTGCPSSSRTPARSRCSGRW